jgi:dipeptidyl aminopeptidase/acylaminoacyl peptidase
MKAGFVVLLLVCGPLLLMSEPGPAKRDITVRDIVEMTRWADEDYFRGANPSDCVAQFSPDGEHFVIVLRKGNFASNVNEYSVYLFNTSAVFRSLKPSLLLEMGSRSNSPAIRAIKWLSDNETLAFVGEREDELPQVYTINIQTRRLTKRTHHRTGIDQFDISPDGKHILFTASERRDDSLTAEQRRHGIVIENQDLENVLAGRFNQKTGEERLFFEEGKEQEVALPPTHQINLNSRLSFSPDGRYAYVKAFFRSTNPDWTLYQSVTLQFWGKNSSHPGGACPIGQYFLFDSLRLTLRQVLDAPAVSTASSHWSPDGHALFLKTFLPIGGVSAAEVLKGWSESFPSRSRSRVWRCVGRPPQNGRAFSKAREGKYRRSRLKRARTCLRRSWHAIS